MENKEIKSYKILDDNFPPNPPIKDAKLYVLNQDTQEVEAYITDRNGNPKPLKDETGSSEGGLYTFFSSDNSITISGTNNVNLILESSLKTLIQSSLQPNDNISELTNDSGYITGYTVTEEDVTAHESALTITESQISDLGNYLENISEDTTPQLGGNLDADYNSITNIDNIEVKGHSYADVEVDNGNSSTADTIDWTEGNFQKSTLTDNCTLTFTDPLGPTTLILKLIQDTTGSRTVTFPLTVLWSRGTAPTLSTIPSSVDLLTFYYDGTNYYGSYVLDYQ